jgi:hypothetical protein
LFQKRQGSPETRSWPIRSTPVCGKTWGEYCTIAPGARCGTHPRSVLLAMC